MIMGKIITISRQYGSGGSEIGRKGAKALSIPYYDRHILLLFCKLEVIETDARICFNIRYSL